jgi:glycosyltransferase involved in cell wall biosynthesis
VKGGIAVVTSGFPRRSETFAVHELRALERAGLLAGIFATKPGDGQPLQPDAERLTAGARVLPPGSPEAQATALAAELRGRPVAAVHGYFAHTPATVAAHAAHRLGIPYGFSVHARDARKVTPAELGARAAGAACVIACNPDAAAEVHVAGAAADVLPHGVDLARFRSTPPPGRRPLALLTVGRLVEKKGFHVLIEAAARLQAPFRLRIVGEGPERSRLQAALEQYGVRDCVELVGALTHAELPREYAEADVVVTPSIADSTGDRDGLPNVVLEAMASSRPVVAGNVGPIATAVDEATGVLVPPGDAAALASALDLLAARPALRVQLGRTARKRVEHDFDLRRCGERFVRRLEAAYA